MHCPQFGWCASLKIRCAKEGSAIFENGTSDVKWGDIDDYELEVVFSKPIAFKDHLLNKTQLVWHFVRIYSDVTRGFNPGQKDGPDFQTKEKECWGANASRRFDFNKKKAFDHDKGCKNSYVDTPYFVFALLGLCTKCFLGFAMLCSIWHNSVAWINAFDAAVGWASSTMEYALQGILLFRSFTMVAANSCTEYDGFKYMFACNKFDQFDWLWRDAGMVFLGMVVMSIPIFCMRVVLFDGEAVCPRKGCICMATYDGDPESFCCCCSRFILI